MKMINRSMFRIEALQAHAAAERRAELRDSQRQLVALGESMGLRADWLELLGEKPVPAPQGKRKAARSSARPESAHSVVVSRHARRGG